MPQLEPELIHLAGRERPQLRQPAVRNLDLHYRDAKGRLQLWSPSWPVLPRDDFDLGSDIYLLLDQGDAVVMRATMENGQVTCTQISPNGARSFTVSREEFASRCLGAVQTTAWRPGEPGAQQGHGDTRRSADGPL